MGSVGRLPVNAASRSTLCEAAGPDPLVQIERRSLGPWPVHAPATAQPRRVPVFLTITPGEALRRRGCHVHQSLRLANAPRAGPQRPDSGATRPGRLPPQSLWPVQHAPDAGGSIRKETRDDRHPGSPGTRTAERRHHCADTAGGAGRPRRSATAVPGDVSGESAAEVLLHQSGLRPESRRPGWPKANGPATTRWPRSPRDA